MDIEKLKAGNALSAKIENIRAKLNFLEKNVTVKLLSIQIDESGKPLETVNFTAEDGIPLGNIKGLIRTQIEKKLQSLEEEFKNL